MNDVLIKFSELKQLDASLQTIIAELGSAATHSDDLEAAIARPYGKGALQDKVNDFEWRWDAKREELVVALTELQERTAATIEAFEQFDADAASMFESGRDPVTIGPAV